ncbi:glycosyltransferase [Candidatus Falkowbacteria bacterium]|jgi:glycosyltransferase involved in cell wall biosynthesis|nr:glycosyltransferase [Candidatus Falkowbacteria bacterium]
MPKVSVIIITYNRADLLSRAINSVLFQDYQDFELLIIDDASTDNTSEIVRAFNDNRIKYYLNEKNLGIAKSRNKGISLAVGEYIAMLDSDDYWISRDKLTRQVVYLDTYLDVALIGTAIRCEDERATVLKEDIFETDDKNIRNKLLWKNQFAQSSVLFKKKAFSGYNDSLDIGEDYDLWLKIGCDYKLANLPDIMTAYLIHDKSITKQKRLKTILVTDKIIRRYKNNYPRYFKARLKTIFRLIINLVKS